jgi:hypothetical protein
VSYRNSQLTKVLQPCLGGNAKAAVVCTVNPAAAHAEETAKWVLGGWMGGWVFKGEGSGASAGCTKQQR